MADFSDDDSDYKAFEADYEQHREELLAMILDYVEDTEMDPVVLQQILIEVALSGRMGGYLTEVQNPSVHGLRKEIDRFQKEVDDQIRNMKKEAAVFVAEYKASVAAEGESGQDDAEKD